MEDDKDMSLHEFLDFLDEWGDHLRILVKFVDFSKIPEQLDELILLDIIVLFFFSDLLQKEFSELLLEEHFMKTDQNLENVHDDFGLGKAETNAIFNFQFFSQHLASVELDQIKKFSVDDGKFIGKIWLSEQKAPYWRIIFEEIIR